MYLHHFQCTLHVNLLSVPFAYLRQPRLLSTLLCVTQQAASPSPIILEAEVQTFIRKAGAGSAPAEGTTARGARLGERQ